MLIAIDPSNASTLYVGVEQDNGKGPPNGLWKTTDGGASWALLGSGSDADPWDSVTSYLDMPIDVAVDPDDANHLYVTSGVRGANQGFWVSTDGGETWIRPKGFNDTSPTHDVTTMSVDPCDFKHVLLSSHSDWAITAGYSSGVVESRDGGASWIVHLPPGDAWAAGTKGVAILHPSAQVGDADTWLVADEGGFWRTSNAGKDWSKVSTAGTPHGSNEFYYSAAGALYAGAFGHPQRSKDNGLTWQSLDQGLPNAAYYAVVGDGNTLYLQPDGYPPATGYLTSAETDGTNWVPYSDTTAPTRGPIRMAFDPVNRILYSANWSGGLWRLKVKSP
jgi:photosystem II stability/assembly factor-like uncharacterized protein